MTCASLREELVSIRDDVLDLGTCASFEWGVCS